MDLRWKPVVHSASRVDIPVLTVCHDAAALRRWKAAIGPFIRSGRKRYFVFREYAELARSGRFILPFEGEAKTRRFAELHTALLLHGEGFFCWGGVRLFKEKKDVIALKGRKSDNTEEVRSRVPWPWPSEIQETLNFQPRNPDIVAYSKERSEWRFCEVKGPGDRVKEEQLEALAVLHLLTGAPVAVVRVVEGASVIASKMRPTKIAYRKGGELDWIRRRLCDQ